MKLAILSDIHSNHHALKSCMNIIKEQHVEGILFFQNLPLTNVAYIDGMPKISMAHGDLYSKRIRNIEG